MTKKYRDIADVIPYSEQVDQTRVPAANDYLIERHVPELFLAPYHHHTSVEINFLEICEMDYSFSGTQTTLAPGHLTVFWGAAPHVVTDVRGSGLITNIYLSLGQFIRWGLPTEFVDAILTGAVLSTTAPKATDKLFMDRLYSEQDHKSRLWRRLHLTEIENRLRRLALEGWTTLLAPRTAPTHGELTSQALLHVEAMLRHIADNFTIPINVNDIAAAANLSQGRASDLFKQVMGVTIRQQLQRARLSHARMQLTETDAKIASVALDSGFASLSTFYEAFTSANRMTPAQYRSQARRGNPFVAEHSSL
jgi:AraC-like DNA-binding protein